MPMKALKWFKPSAGGDVAPPPPEEGTAKTSVSKISQEAIPPLITSTQQTSSRESEATSDMPRHSDKPSNRSSKTSRTNTQDDRHLPAGPPTRSPTFHQEGQAPYATQRRQLTHQDERYHAPQPVPARQVPTLTTSRDVEYVARETGLRYEPTITHAAQVPSYTEQLVSGQRAVSSPRQPTASRDYQINAQSQIPIAHVSSPSSQPGVPTVVIFGETGTGKSSLINMIADEEVAGVSNDALGFTFGSAVYEVKINGSKYRLWDTAGLNEGEHGTVPAEQALHNLQELVHKLRDGVNLLVYCIRGSRFRDILKVNYDLFAKIICEGKVPIVVVITGLENESPMENWWEENGTEFGKQGMTFQGHACVTTSKGKKIKSGGFMFEDEYDESKEIVRQLIIEKCPRRPWVANGRSWMQNIARGIARYYEVYNIGGQAGIEQDRRGVKVTSQTAHQAEGQVSSGKGMVGWLYSWAKNIAGSLV